MPRDSSIGRATYRITNALLNPKGARRPGEWSSLLELEKNLEIFQFNRLTLQMRRLRLREVRWFL